MDAPVTPLLDALAAKIADDIAAIGQQISAVSRRYEDMFARFRQEVASALDQTASMPEAVHVATILTDAAAIALRRSFSGVSEAACKEGCSACCRLFVAIPPGTGPLIARYVRETFSPDALNDLTARLQEAASAIEASDAPAQTRIRCPLLGNDNRCSVYPVRPLACRAFSSKNAARCRSFIFDADPSAGGGIEQIAPHYRLHQETVLALVDAAHARGLDPRHRNLVQILLEDLRA